MLSRRYINRELHVCHILFFLISSNFNVSLDIDLLSSRFNNYHAMSRGNVTHKHSASPGVQWTYWYIIYLFPPFNLLTRILCKFRDNKVEKVLLIAPTVVSDNYSGLINHCSIPPINHPWSSQRALAICWYFRTRFKSLRSLMARWQENHIRVCLAANARWVWYKITWSLQIMYYQPD